MSEKDLRAALEQIRGIAEAALGGVGAKPRARRAKPSAHEPKTRASLPDHILDLREAKFFKEPRTAREVHTKLSATYHCEQNRVVIALLRLQRGRQLRRATKQEGDKTQVAYVW
jgi:hypothetical protein